MKIYTTDSGEIKAVGQSSDPNLNEIEVNDATNPFTGWSTAKICCYQVYVENGEVLMMTPYIASSALERIEEFGKEMDELADKALAADILLGVTE